MKNPKECKYTKEHEWVKFNGEIATIGITHHAQELLTDIVFVELPDVDKEIEQFKPFMIVESVKSVSDVFAPVSGKIVEINNELSDKPQLINESAFDKGWLVKIKYSNIEESKSLMTKEDYDSFSKEH